MSTARDPSLSDWRMVNAVANLGLTAVAAIVLLFVGGVLSVVGPPFGRALGLDADAAAGIGRVLFPLPSAAFLLSAFGMWLVAVARSWRGGRPLQEVCPSVTSDRLDPVVAELRSLGFRPEALISPAEAPRAVLATDDGVIAVVCECPEDVQGARPTGQGAFAATALVSPIRLGIEVIHLVTRNASPETGRRYGPVLSGFFPGADASRLLDEHRAATRLLSTLGIETAAVRAGEVLDELTRMEDQRRRGPIIGLVTLWFGLRRAGVEAGRLPPRPVTAGDIRSFVGLLPQPRRREVLAQVRADLGAQPTP